MYRKISLAVALAAAIGPVGVHALGVGDIHPRSGLNQRFDADIDLMSVKPGELKDIKVTLAPQEAFARAGIDRPYWLTQLQFQPMRLPDGRVVVRVTTKDAVREPFLNFLVEVDGPEGRLLHEYTVLLDPPVTTGRRPSAIAVPAVSATPVLEPTRTPSTGARSEEYGPVRQNDTLWSIARNLRREGETTQQMAMALLAVNPDAFHDNNINNLLRGKVLRVPSPEEVRALSSRKASETFKSQLD